jgi:hypothetical protein
LRFFKNSIALSIICLFVLQIDNTNIYALNLQVEQFDFQPS